MKWTLVPSAYLPYKGFDGQLSCLVTNTTISAQIANLPIGNNFVRQSVRPTEPQDDTATKTNDGTLEELINAAYGITVLGQYSFKNQ